jgi:hypothetical protein
VTREEINQALGELRNGWPYSPIPDGQLRHFRRVFERWKLETFREVLDGFIDRGEQRPGPADLVAAMQKHAGIRPVADGFKQAPGPFLDDDDPDLTPSEEYPARVAAIRASLAAHPANGGPS